MRIEYSPIAVRDLERVWAEVFESSVSEETTTKFVTFKSYMVFYKVETDRMLVSRVVYGKSDYMRTIFRMPSAMPSLIKP